MLAAGASRRFGSQKLLADLRGKPVVCWAVERLLHVKLDEVIVVVGHDGDVVRAALAGLEVRVVVNDDWQEGIGSSLRVGVAAVRTDTHAVMIALGDQPGVDSTVVATLLAARAGSDREIIVPSYRGERGHPVIFTDSVFPELLAVSGDRGARDVVARDPGRVLTVDVDAPPPLDVDTQEALRLLVRSIAIP